MESYQELEFKFGEFCRNPNTVACSSGSAALHLALETLRVTEGWGQHFEREWGPTVAIPDFTMIAVARAVTLAGMNPDFLDVDSLGLLHEETKTLDETTGVLAVHTYGRKCYTGFYHHEVIEDLAEAHGIQPNPNSLAACWSFYRNKIICGEEGGMVAFKNSEQVKVAKQLRDMGSSNQNDFWHIPRGMNYRLSNCHAELILESLRGYVSNLWQRKTVENQYNRYCPIEWQLPTRDVPWVYDLDLPLDADMQGVVQRMNKNGIAVRCGFKPLSQQREYQTEYAENPVTEGLSKTRMYLPIVPGMTEDLVKRIIGDLRKEVENAPSLASG